MTLGHRLTAAYAIIVTSLLVGFNWGFRRLLELEIEFPGRTMSETERIRYIVHVIVPFLALGCFASLLFLVFTRHSRRRFKIGGGSDRDRDAPRLTSTK
jgi:hypothetical protein